jgi:hypothetical protein
VAEFLAATRKVQLEDSKFNVQTPSRSGKKKVSYKIDEWRKVSESIGPTTLMNILYRKRIKGNYAEIDLFQFEGFRSKDIYSALLYVVSCLNFVHEAYIYKALGDKNFSYLFTNFDPNEKCNFLEKRIEMIAKMNIGII